MSNPKLSRFEVLGRLATGGMAEVWLARVLGAAGFEKLVVLKTILPQLALHPTFVSMFINEGRLAAMLSHPNCVQVFDLGQEDGTLYLSMEYVEGFSLSRLLKRAKERNLPPPEKVLARIVMDAASGLDYAHKLKDREGRHLQLVHRDVSPDNLLISFSGQTKVVDFGIARAVTPAILAAATSAGTIKGKHGFISPEYLLGHPIDHRADVFALGVVLYRALTRRRPFGGNSDAEISLAVINHTPRPPHEVSPEVGPALSSVVMMALEKDPKDRFESARALRQAIEVAVVRAAENEDVADYMNLLWPPGDDERVSLEALAKAGRADESSDPALPAFDSGTWSNPVATPAQPEGFVPPSERAPLVEVQVGAPEELTRELPRPPLVEPQLAGVHATPPTVEELLRPPGHAAPRAEVDAPRRAQQPATPVFASAPTFDAPSGRSRWVVLALALLTIIGAAVAYALRGARPVEATSVAVAALPGAPAPTTAHVTFNLPTPVKVFEGKEELGTTPLERDLEPGPHALRLVNKAQGIDQALTLTLTAGDRVVVDAFAKGALVVKAEPWAEVTVDGRAHGVTPVTVKPLLEGVHVVEFKNAAYAARRVEVRIRGGETKTLNIDLTSEE